MEEKRITRESCFFTFLCSNPLFSTVFTLYTLILLYFPTFFRGIIFSPVIFFTSIILLYLLRLGASQKTQKETGSNSPEFDSPPKLLPLNEESSDHDLNRVSYESDSEPSATSYQGPNFLADCFVEWDVRAPLEVIHEEYEGEEEGNEAFWEEKREAQMAVIEKYASLSLYYPESDTETSSEGDSPKIEDWELSEHLCSRWEDDDKEGLIEIELDGKKNNSEVDEDNLIEINLFPSR
ncbi:uncharacterized protein LOC111407156 [Olea europaea var. sylvestris]|uniref:Uncharacterized protein n=1 Tax=Olea europaea subsp. europaea TaxID=158383 RepID=A0A8S0TM68_OLEEU|nr:uncharacterized protein LOC111407156 [Olea europaea var. sylvestris]CAA3005882.1 Hypothetical predicted protein [Olea europaea subsp. europaea]